MSALAIGLTLFGGCLLSAFLPLVSAELLVLSVVALAPRALALPLAAVATLGQMTGKTALFLASRGVLRLPRGRVADKLERALARVDPCARPTGWLLFLSAVGGLPPFYLMTIASGLLRVRLGRYLVLGASGRFLRFGALVLLPQLAAALRP